MVPAAGDDGIAVEDHSMSLRNEGMPQDDLPDSEQATLATTLAMLAHAPAPGYNLPQLQDSSPVEGTDTPDGQQLLAKRNGAAAGLSLYRDSKQQRLDAGEYSGTPPDSPLSATAAAAAVAAAAGLHQLSSASAAEFDTALGTYHTSEDGMNHITNGSAHGHHGTAGAVNTRSTPAQIMQQLVDCGVLPSCGPDTHCFVKCGMVQGVFSLASGTILCLCDACSESNHGEPTWFAPAAFERHGGMAASKKWRGSIQVKGLTQRKTLGQWLDERGVTAKPRLTLADQVQQVGGSRQRSGPALGGRGTGGANDLTAAAANAARLAGVGRAPPSSGGSRPPSGQAGGLAIQTTTVNGMDMGGIDAYSPQGVLQYDAVSAGLPQFENLSEAPTTYAPPPTTGAAPAEVQQTGGVSTKLQRLLAELAAEGPAGAAALAALEQAQQQPLSKLLQQLQGVQHQPQHASTLQPSLPLAPAAEPAEDTLAKLIRLLPGVVPASAAAITPVMEPVAAPQPAVPAAAQPAVSAALHLARPAMKVEPDRQVIPAVASAAAAATADEPAVEQPTDLLLTLATAKAVSEPMESFNLLSQALQQQLQRHGESCKEAAAAASAAVAAAGERICGKTGDASAISAAAAFAAIAAAAAAAAAAVAGQSQQQAVAEQVVQQQQQELVVVSAPQQQQQQQKAHSPLSAQSPPSTAAAAVQDLLAARGVPASVAQLMVGMLGAQQAPQQQVPAQPPVSEAYSALVNVLLREMTAGR